MPVEKRICDDVTKNLNKISHPLRPEIDMLRKIIVDCHPAITENFKWNGPNYVVGNEDRITMRIHPPGKSVQLIFHRGAKKQPQPSSKLITDSSNLLDWKGNDRAVMTFTTIKDIEDKTTSLVYIVNEWIRATS